MALANLSPELRQIALARMAARRRTRWEYATDSLIQAIASGKEPIRFSGEHVERERNLAEHKALECRNREEYGMVRNHWTDQAVFRYNGKRTCKRKGHVRNNQEPRTIERAHRAHKLAKLDKLRKK